MANNIDIMLVEDNPMDVRLVVEALKKSSWNYNISVAGTGEQAIDMLKKKGEYRTAPTPDIIILDLKLPARSGLEVLAETKADPQLRKIPVVVLTSSDSQEDIEKSYDLSASAFFTKPLSVNEYMSLVRSIEEMWVNNAKLPGK